MAWESRRKSRGRYYYRVRRWKGRVVKRYVGRATDATTQVIALVERLKKAERKAAAASSRRDRAAYQEADALVVALCDVGQALTTAGLLKAGFYRNQRMPWQKRRRKRMAQSKPCQMSLTAPTQEEFRQLVRRAEAGDAEALAQVEQILDLHPAVWQQAADLTARVESALIRLIASKNKLLTKSLERKVRQMKADLAGVSPSSLERGVIDRIVACWLQVQFAEVASVEHADDRESNSWQKRVDQAQRRYLSAVNCLATVRKLLAK